MASDLLTVLERLLRPMKNRIANSIARAVIERVDDATKLQMMQLQVLSGEPVEDGERFQEFGFYSVPHAGAEAVVLFPNGDRGHPLVVATDDRRYRPTGGEPGEVGLYNGTGARVRLMPNGDIVVVPADGRSVLVGSGSATDPVALKSDVDSLITTFNKHIHTTTATVGATATPGVIAKTVDPHAPVAGATKVRAV